MATHPLDTIRTRMSLSRDLGAQYRGIIDCGMQVRGFNLFLFLFVFI